MSDKAVVVAAGLGGCGLENQEGLISQLGKISRDVTSIRDESFGCTLKFIRASFKPYENFNKSSTPAPEIRIQQLVFDKKPLDECLESMEYYKNLKLKVGDYKNFLCSSACTCIYMITVQIVYIHTYNTFMNIR